MVAIVFYLGLLILGIWCIKMWMRQQRVRKYTEAGLNFNAVSRKDFENLSGAEILAYAEKALEAARTMTELADEKSVYEVEEAKEALAEAERLMELANSRKANLEKLD